MQGHSGSLFSFGRDGGFNLLSFGVSEGAEFRAKIFGCSFVGKGLNNQVPVHDASTTSLLATLQIQAAEIILKTGTDCLRPQQPFIICGHHRT